MSGSRVLLISAQNRVWIGACERELTKMGIETVEAYNCWSGECALGQREIEVVVIDAGLLCPTVSPDRPGPILGRSPQLRVVVIDAGELEPEHRAAATSHEAQLVEGTDVEEIARVVASLLPASVPSR